MSDLFEQAVAEASLQLSRSCLRPRHHVAWLTGAPQVGKSILASRLCDLHRWKYLDYTLTPGYFDALSTRITTYQPDDFIRDIWQWSAACSEPVLVLDEIDALMAFWSQDQRRSWAATMARQAGLPKGLLLVSHFFDCDQLQSLLPDNDSSYCYHLYGDRL